MIQKMTNTDNDWYQYIDDQMTVSNKADIVVLPRPYSPRLLSLESERELLSSWFKPVLGFLSGADLTWSEFDRPEVEKRLSRQPCVVISEVGREELGVLGKFRFVKVPGFFGEGYPKRSSRRSVQQSSSNSLKALHLWSSAFFLKWAFGTTSDNGHSIEGIWAV